MKKVISSLIFFMSICLVSFSQEESPDNEYNSTTTRSSCSPLIQSVWGETISNDGYDANAYNANSPIVNGCLAPAGSAAVAMGQLVYYWHYPFFMTEEQSLFNWCQMSNELITTDPCYDVNQKNICKLLRECGYASEMNYTCSGSSATPSNVKKALERYFHFHVGNTYRDVLLEPADPGPLFPIGTPEHDDYEFMLSQYEDFLDDIMGSLDHGQPILCVKSEDIYFLCDGYTGNGGVFRVHLNYGRANASINGYVTLDEIAGCKMLMDIYPTIDYQHDSSVNLTLFYSTYLAGAEDIPPYSFVPGDAYNLESASVSSPQIWRTIPANKTSIYQAYHEIDLVDGFEAMPGSNFTAQIISCCESRGDIVSQGNEPYNTQNDEEQIFDIIHLMGNENQNTMTNLFPNPTDGPLTMATDGMAEAVFIHDFVGRPVGGWHLDALTESFVTLDVSALRPGAYLLTVTTSTGTRTARFVRR